MPRLHINDRFRVLDQSARTIVADGLSVDDVHATLEQILTDHSDTDPTVGICRFWARARYQGSSFYTWYRILPVEPDDADAHTQLLAAALRRRWPDAAFTVMPIGDRSVSIRWIDGPSNFAVYDYCLHVAGSRGTFDSARYTRILTHRAWQSVASLVEAWLPVTVPRTETGEIDWFAAEAIDLDGAALVAGHRVCCKPNLISVTLGELLRHLPDACDLTDQHGPTVAPAHTQEPDAEQL
ncbi:hypothetical protein [Nocardia sp. NPDC058114]|uniref:hypothetical protein n=1 Tax=Nocardia sp. NPDC058114 TaxID=3346346 RepID=UPI0036DB1148